MKNKYVEKNFEEEYRKATRLDNKTKAIIILNVIMFVFSIYIAIIEKEFTWVLCGLLWGIVALNQYCDSKLLKMKEAIINIQEECIKVKDNIIDELFKDFYCTKRINLKEIKIQKQFKYPRKEKLQSRYEYYNKNKTFEVPIILDIDNKLIDGYTSYLIAKKYGIKNVEVKVKIER